MQYKRTRVKSIYVKSATLFSRFCIANDICRKAKVLQNTKQLLFASNVSCRPYRISSVGAIYVELLQHVRRINYCLISYEGDILPIWQLF